MMQARDGDRKVIAMTKMTRLAGIGFSVCLLVALQTRSVQASDDRSGAFDLHGDAAEGQGIYLRHCASCHGPQGAGNGQEGKAFDSGSSDFTVVEADAGRFYRATRDGGMAVGLSGAMPVYRHTLDDDEIHDVVAYLMQLAR